MARAVPGRNCPVSYRYGAAALAAPAALRAETLWIAGGLYGNPFALDALEALVQREPGDKALVFNGDFHWFDVDPREFARINARVLRHCAMRGNVETELARPHGAAGCGCAYPEWVGDATVERSNHIIERLRDTARRDPAALERLAALPMHLVAEVAGVRVAIVHGDADSLAGWAFSQESLRTEEGCAAAEAAFARAGASVFASSHTCLPVLQLFAGDRAVVNNGAAGMPNFRGTAYGLATRIASTPSGRALYGARVGALHVEAVPLEFDAAAWRSRFLAQWPAGSAAHLSYYDRIVDGPHYTAAAALRREKLPAALRAA
jgi:hypothetical protein